MDVYVEGGLGDCVFLAQQLPLYVRRGIDISVACGPDKAILFRPCGVKIRHTRDDAPALDWHYAEPLDDLDPVAVWRCNIPAVNFGSPPMPFIGTAEELWVEFCQVRLDVRPFISDAEWNSVREFLAPLPRPIILLHSKGNSWAAQKNIPDDLTEELYQHLLVQIPGTLILLDWDDRVPRSSHERVRHLTDHWEPIDVTRMLALMHLSDLMIGIDSGPLYAAGYTQIPVVGFYPTADHYPVRFGPPRGRQVHLVPGDLTPSWNRRARVAYNIIECGRDRFDMHHAAVVCHRMLAGPRYLDQDRLGADVLLQELIEQTSDRTPGPLPASSRGYGLDALLVSLKGRFEHPTVVVIGGLEGCEIGTETGRLSYLLAVAAMHTSGALTVLDPSPARCAQTRDCLRGIPSTDVVCCDPLDWLSGRGDTIDMLVIDHGDAQDAAEWGLTALPRLSRHGMIVIDSQQSWSSSATNRATVLIPRLLELAWVAMDVRGIRIVTRTQSV